MNKPSKTFFELDVWKKAHELVLDVYQTTNDFPKSELFGITGQLRRAVISIPSNIAEGYRRFGRADKIRFYNIAQASLEEVKYFIYLSKDLDYKIEYQKLKNMTEEISKMLDVYVRQIKNS